jgi:hypothetical protein
MPAANMPPPGMGAAAMGPPGMGSRGGPSGPGPGPGPAGFFLVPTFCTSPCCSVPRVAGCDEYVVAFAMVLHFAEASSVTSSLEYIADMMHMPAHMTPVHASSQ